MSQTASRRRKTSADDTTLAAAHPSLEVVNVTSILTASFSATKEFCQSHGLTINPAKTQLITFKAVGKRIPDDFQFFHLMLDNCSISPQTTVKLLGVTLDQHLTFRTQIDNVDLPKQLLKLTYTALIRSHLEYCSSLYSSVANTHRKKLDIIQRKSGSYHILSTH